MTDNCSSIRMTELH